MRGGPRLRVGRRRGSLRTEQGDLPAPAATGAFGPAGWTTWPVLLIVGAHETLVFVFPTTWRNEDSDPVSVCLAESERRAASTHRAPAGARCGPAYPRRSGRGG